MIDDPTSTIPTNADKLAPVRAEHKNRNNWHGTALLIEALIILAVVVACITVFVQLFSYSYNSNVEDNHRAYAITLATNQAETFAAQAADLPEQSSTDENGYVTTCTITKESTARGTLYHADITVYYREQELCTIQTARYVNGGR